MSGGIAPGTWVLKPDLSWIRAGDIKVGDKLLAFDEFCELSPVDWKLIHPRRWRITCVLDVQRLTQPCFRLKLDDGREVVASGDQEWLCGSGRSRVKNWRWVSTRWVACNGERRCSWIFRIVDVCFCPDAYDIGWLGGFFDGEGSIHGRHGIDIRVAQREGPLAERARSLLKQSGFLLYSIRRRNSDSIDIRITGGMAEQLRFLMLVRPTRLLANLLEFIEDVSVHSGKTRALSVVEKEHVGMRETVSISTESHTLIAEGLGAHDRDEVLC